MAFYPNIKLALNHFLDLIYPPLCFGCNEVLSTSERVVCTKCKLDLPIIENPVITERIRDRLIDINPAYLVCYLKYQKGNITQKLLHSLKYEGYENVGLTLGQWFGEYLSGKINLNEIDLVVPVPLHKSKLKKRGFNQSSVIANGIGEITGLEVIEKALVRTNRNKTQTKKSRFSRMLNVREIFAVKNPKAITGKHILLLDDVITTGSTIAACASVVKNAGARKVSIIALAAAQ